MQRENGWKSYHTSFGYIEPHLIGQQGIRDGCWSAWITSPFSMTYGAETIIPLET